MEAALEGEGRCAGLLADSLLRVTREPELRVAVGKGRLCLATPYPPAAATASANAMGRNKLIYAASDTTLVVAADREQDTTVAGATEAIEHGYGDVAVWTGPGAGPSNESLVALGARPITNLDQLWDASPTQRTPSVARFAAHLLRTSLGARPSERRRGAGPRLERLRFGDDYLGACCLELPGVRSSLPCGAIHALVQKGATNRRHNPRLTGIEAGKGSTLWLGPKRRTITPSSSSTSSKTNSAPRHAGSGPCQRFPQPAVH